jgi:hypothetical protein
MLGCAVLDAPRAPPQQACSLHRGATSAKGGWMMRVSLFRVALECSRSTHVGREASLSQHPLCCSEVVQQECPSYGGRG